MRKVPLLDYWNELAYPDGVPSLHSAAPPDDPSAYVEWRAAHTRQSAQRERVERTAWATIVGDAIAGRIKVFAYKGPDTIDRSVDWYPGASGATREMIPADFFAAHETFCAPFPTVIYIDEPSAPTIFNAPWYDPIAIVIAEKNAKVRRRGAKPKADWEGVGKDYDNEVRRRGRPDISNVAGWQIQADVERWLADYLLSEGIQVAESTLREHAKKLMARPEVS